MQNDVVRLRTKSERNAAYKSPHGSYSRNILDQFKVSTAHWNTFLHPTTRSHTTISKGAISLEIPGGEMAQKGKPLGV